MFPRVLLDHVSENFVANLMLYVDKEKIFFCF